MMETQKILKPVGKIVIICDYREEEVIENLKKMDAVINERSLEVGDFIVSHDVAIERKKNSDFISSIIDGRLFEQAKLLKENFSKPIIIIEGYSDRQINENALKAAIASLIIDFDVSLINTKNPFDTAKTIYWIAKKEQEENKQSVSFKVGKKPKGMKELKERLVSSLPGISTVISRRLLEHFGTAEKVFTASEPDLQNVRGVGKKLSNKIRRILIENYR